MSKIKFYRRVRSAIIGLTGKSNDRIISDCMMISPLANDKGTPIRNENSGKKTSFSRTRVIRRNSTINK